MNAKYIVAWTGMSLDFWAKAIIILKHYNYYYYYKIKKEERKNTIQLLWFQKCTVYV